jgi:hypothetical protein
MLKGYLELVAVMLAAFRRGLNEQRNALKRGRARAMCN